MLSKGKNNVDDRSLNACVFHDLLKYFNMYMNIFPVENVYLRVNNVT